MAPTRRRNAACAPYALIFLPDVFLGAYIQSRTGRKLILWMGECHLHAGIRPEDIQAMMERHPDADLLLHPKCGCVSQCMYALAEGDLPADRTHILSTGGMVRHARTCRAAADLVGTEVGLLYRLRKENPGKQFIPVREDAICEYVKTITLVPEAIAEGARAAIERMVAIA